MGRGGERGSCDDDDDDDHLLLISEDVLIQILLWLPVISLLRFKSVCKSWRSIIQSPFFIHLHTTTTTTKLSKLGVHVKKGNVLTLSGEEFEFFENLGIPVTPVEYLLDVEERFEVLKEFVEFSVVGCCDGIICLHDYFTRNVVLWNPAIKQSRILPKPSNLLGFFKCFAKMFINDDDGYWAEDFVRFGIDIKTNDYKLLLITTYKLINGYGGERRVHVYSLSTDSWKCIDDDATLLSAAHPDLDIDIKVFHKYNQGLYLNGSYFFTADYINQDMPLLLSFDFTEEIFRTIQLPFDLRINYNYIPGNIYFISFGEKVALIYAKREEEEEEEVHDCVQYDIWVLNEQHGVKEPWTKFYTIGPPDNLPNEPLLIKNNGEFAITYGWYWQDDRKQDVPKLQLLNLMTWEKKVLQCDCESLNTDTVYVYKPSLMPIGGNGAAHNSRFLEFDGTP